MSSRPARTTTWALSDAERRSLGIEPLPQNLGEAIDLMERSELVAETLGEHVFDFFLRNKKQEWEGVPLRGHPVRAAQEPAGAVGAGQGVPPLT
ncbi:hypothetical protein SANTM175S_01746 [Streptomyces antimycoticus]